MNAFWLRWALLVCLFLAVLVACVPPRQALGNDLPPVTADGARLLAGGRPFEVRGVNYVHKLNADTSRCGELTFGADGNCPWDHDTIVADLEQLRGFGVNTIRIFLNYYAFGGARIVDPNYDMSMPLAHLDALITEANQRGMYVMPVLLAKYPQDQFGPAGYTTALDLHIRPVVQHLAGRDGVIAWDLFNEPDLGGPVDPRCWDWDNADFPLCFPLAEERQRFIQVINDEVKRLDPETLTTVSLGFAKNYFRPVDAALRLADMVDVLSYHYYDNEPFDSGRYEEHWYYGEGFPADFQRANRELHELGLNKPILITEIGFPTGPGTTRTLEDMHRDLRTALRISREDRTSGVMIWPFQATPEEYLGNLF